MSFEDLPADWPDHPVDHPAFCADILDLFVSERSRQRGCLFLLVCDAQHRAVQPIEILDIEIAPPADTVALLKQMVPTLQEFPGCTLLTAIARPGRLKVFWCDAAWRDCIVAAFDGIPLLGVHLVTPAGSLAFDVGPAAA
jgi:hypothetical protein